MTDYRPRKSGSYFKANEAAEPRLVARTEEAPREKQAASAPKPTTPKIDDANAVDAAPEIFPAGDETGVQAPRKRKE